MAKNKRYVLNDVELQPQVIGHTYKKKSNLLRVIIIFAILIGVVYYIDDVSVYINKLLGLNTASTIEQNSGNVNLPSNDKSTKYYDFTDNLSVQEINLIFNNFIYDNNNLTFDINNTSGNTIDYMDKKYFLETYQDNTLVGTYKLDINILNPNTKITLSLNNVNSFNKLAIVEKNIADYPDVNLSSSANGESQLTCKLGNEQINYIFSNDGLKSINHTITDYLTNVNYNSSLTTYQNLVNSYSGIAGVNATINITDQGFTAVFNIDLINANLSNIKNKYYYAYKEMPKVINYEMTSYGFTCN